MFTLTRYCFRPGCGQNCFGALVVNECKVVDITHLLPINSDVVLVYSQRNEDISCLSTTTVSTAGWYILGARREGADHFLPTHPTEGRRREKRKATKISSRPKTGRFTFRFRVGLRKEKANGFLWVGETNQLSFSSQQQQHSRADNSPSCYA